MKQENFGFPSGIVVTIDRLPRYLMDDAFEQPQVTLESKKLGQPSLRRKGMNVIDLDWRGLDDTLSLAL